MRWKAKPFPSEAELKVHKRFAFLPTIVSDRDVLYYIWLEPYYKFQTAIYDELVDCIDTEDYRYVNKYECVSMCKVQINKGKYVL